MAISFVASTVWANSTGGTIQPGAWPTGTTTDDRVYCIATWKDFSVTATCADDTTAAAWTELDESADGSVATGNGTGSMKVGVWYYDFVGGSDTGPRVTFTGGPPLSMATQLTFRKDASDTWGTPTFTNGNQAASSTISVTGGSNLNYAAGDLLIAVLGIRDDGTFTSFSADATGITWASAFNAAPAANGSTTNGNDCSAAAGYRIASSGTSSAAPTMSGTLAATETGRGTFIRQTVSVADTRVPKYQPMVQLLAH